MWDTIEPEIVWVILLQLMDTADGPQSIQGMLCVNKHWNAVIMDQMSRLNEDAARMRRAYASAFIMRVQFLFPETTLMLRASRGVERAFRYHHLSRLVAPTKMQLRVANYDTQLTLAQRARLVSLVSRAMMVLNHHRERWDNRVDAYGNAWFTVKQRVPLMHNSRQFRAGKKHSVTFLPRSSSATTMTDYVHGKRSLGRHRKRPTL